VLKPRCGTTGGWGTNVGWGTGCHDVVWPVGASSRGKAPVADVGPVPGTVGITAGAAVPVPEPDGATGAGEYVPLPYGRPRAAPGVSSAGGTVVAPADGVPLGAEAAAPERGISGIGRSEGAGASAGGVVGWSGLACGAACMVTPDCGVIGW